MELYVNNQNTLGIAGVSAYDNVGDPFKPTEGFVHLFDGFSQTWVPTSDTLYTLYIDWDTKPTDIQACLWRITDWDDTTLIEFQVQSGILWTTVIPESISGGTQSLGQITPTADTVFATYDIGFEPDAYRWRIQGPAAKLHTLLTLSAHTLRDAELNTQAAYEGYGYQSSDNYGGLTRVTYLASTPKPTETLSWELLSQDEYDAVEAAFDASVPYSERVVYNARQYYVENSLQTKIAGACLYNTGIRLLGQD